ncbi:hypothetical protein HK104_003545 [Borealophlyctis nickersoniae]|nr:hypothetical protein HK104_003545 [Borealophlyctis nickersoniae]
MAEALDVPLDLMLVRKLGIPFHEETAMGAIAMNNITYVDEPLIRRLRIPDAAVSNVIKKETDELARRNVAYRGDKPYPDLKDKNVIIVDGEGRSDASTRVHE